MEGVDDVFLHFENFQFSFQRSIVNVIYVYIHIYTIYKYIYTHIYGQKKCQKHQRFKIMWFSNIFSIYGHFSPCIVSSADVTISNFTFFRRRPTYCRTHEALVGLFSFFDGKWCVGCLLVGIKSVDIPNNLQTDLLRRGLMSFVFGILEGACRIFIVSTGILGQQAMVMWICEPSFLIENVECQGRWLTGHVPYKQQIQTRRIMLRNPLVFFGGGQRIPIFCCFVMFLFLCL